MPMPHRASKAYKLNNARARRSIAWLFVSPLFDSLYPGILMSYQARALAGALFSVFAIAATVPHAVSAEELADVSTAFRWLGKNDRVVIEAYDDPKVQGVTCYVSRARTGGVKGTVGLAEDKSEASIACRQVAPTVQFKDKLPVQEDVFTERMSILFKRLHVVRVVDAKRNTLVYLTYSDKLIDGSPMNAVTAVPVAPSTPIPVK